MATTEIEQLYREHRAGLVRLVERELHDHYDAEDVVQTAFLDAQRALERGTIPRHPRAWIAAIALNAGRRLRRRSLNAEPLEDFAVQEASRMPEIRAALASLPREQRTAVVYRDVLGFSYDETAELMGTSVNAVTMLLHRGRRRLRQTLGGTAAGIGLWRWAKHAAMPQLTAAKAAAAVVLAGGLATTGVVAARLVAPVGSDTTAATRAPAATSGGGLRLQSTPRHRAKHGAARTHSASHASRQGSTRGAAAGAAGSPTAAATPSRSGSTLPVPGVSVPSISVPGPPVTVAATVTVSTPVATVTATTPTAATVTTPITTVTVPIP